VKFEREINGVESVVIAEKYKRGTYNWIAIADTSPKPITYSGRTSGLSESICRGLNVLSSGISELTREVVID
jgi:hypothetical protein